MKIFSKDKNSSLSLEKVDDNFGYSTYSIATSISLGHSEFNASNDDIHLLNLSEFIEALDKFVLQRSIEPTLQGTYDSFLKVRGKTTSVILDFSIGSAHCENETLTYNTNGSFELSQENLDLIISDLKDLI